MSKWIEKKTPPVLPIYFAALVWLVGGIVLVLIGVKILLEHLGVINF